MELFFFSLSFRFQFFISKTLTLAYCIAWKLSGSFSLQIKDKLCLAVTFLKYRTWARSYTPCLLLFFELQPWLAWDISLKKSEKVPPTAKSTDINKRFLVACLLPWRVFFFSGVLSSYFSSFAGVVLRIKDNQQILKKKRRNFFCYLSFTMILNTTYPFLCFILIKNSLMLQTKILDNIFQFPYFWFKEIFKMWSKWNHQGSEIAESLEA